MKPEGLGALIPPAQGGPGNIPLYPQGQEQTEASHLLLWDLTQPCLPHLQTGPFQHPSLSLGCETGWECHPDGFPFSGGSQRGRPGRSSYGTQPCVPQTQPSLLPEPGQVTTPSMTQFP